MSQPPAFFLGWDVGGWNCDNNGASRDAIVILDAHHSIVCKPWRGNLRSSIHAARTSRGWIEVLFALCGAQEPQGSAGITLAIDTPLGFSQAFVGLVCGLQHVEPLNGSATKPYLVRQAMACPMAKAGSACPGMR